MVKIRMLLFSSISDRYKERDLELVLEKNVWPSSESLKLYLIEILDDRMSRRDRMTANKELSPRSLMLVINENMVDTCDSITLQHGDIVTLIPPVSGG